MPRNARAASAEEITLIGVSKTHPAEAIQQAFDAGLRHFGENRVQEWEGKRAALRTCLQRGTSSAICKATRPRKPRSLFHSIDAVDDLHWRKSWIAPALQCPPSAIGSAFLSKFTSAAKTTKSGVSEDRFARIGREGFGAASDWSSRD